MRPTTRLSPTEAAHLPLFGRLSLSNADVAMMIRAEFHEDPRFLDQRTRARFARRGAAMVALVALAGLGGELVARLRLGDYDRQRAVLRCRWHRLELELPVTPALAFVLDSWLACRPANQGDALLPSERGEPGAGSIMQFLRHLGWRLGAQRSLATLLREFHRARVANAGPDAFDHYWRVQRDRKRPRPQTGEALRPLVAASDPFGGQIRFLTRPHRAAAETRLPAAAWQAGETLRGNRLAADDPLIVALSATRSLKGKSGRIAALDRVFATHRGAIHAALTRRVSLVWLAAVGGIDHRAFKRHLARADAGQPVRAGPPPRPAPPRPTENETRRLDAIAATVWPKRRGALHACRRQTLNRHFAFVRRLVRERKLTCKAARQLFRLSAKQMTLRIFDFDHGLFPLAVAPRPAPAPRQLAQALAVREYAADPAQSWTALWKRLRLDYHYPLDFAAFVAALRSYRAGRYRAPARIAAAMRPLARNG